MDEDKVSASDIEYLQYVLHFPYFRNRDETSTASDDNNDESYIDGRLVQYQENFKPIYKQAEIRGDNTFTKEQLSNTSIDNDTDAVMANGKDDFKSNKKTKKRKRDRIKCIEDCDKPATANTERCKYHNRQVKTMIKKICVDETEYYLALCNNNDKLSETKLRKISSTLFCKNHPSRKSYRTGLCSACYRQNKK